MKTNFLFFIVLYLCACTTSPDQKITKKDSTNTIVDGSVTQKPLADVATILAKKEVPVLCYHHIRERNETYSVTPTNFANQMKALYDSGYKSVLPEDLYNYLVHGKELPSKPVMITFDDTDKEQFELGAGEMNKYGFKGVFFIMTISLKII